MKIAITGANGFVGSNLANYFHRKGFDVMAVIRPQADTTLLEPGIALFRVDYADPAALSNAFEGVGIVIHNAGKTTALSFDEMISANVGLTRKALTAAQTQPSLKQFIYISSLAATRPPAPGETLTEAQDVAPLTWYGKSKALAERVIRAECKVPWTIVRPVSIYGEGDRDFLTIFKLLNSGINFRIGHKDRQLNMIYIQELCRFIELYLSRETALGQVFFASDGETYTQAQVATLISSLLGKRRLNLVLPESLVKLVFLGGDAINRLRGRSSLFNRQKLKEMLVPSWTCSITKARDLLGWDPDPRLEQNLKATLEWYRSRGWL